jgi:hypothetical protein
MYAAKCPVCGLAVFVRPPGQADKMVPLTPHLAESADKNASFAGEDGFAKTANCWVKEGMVACPGSGQMVEAKEAHLQGCFS